MLKNKLKDQKGFTIIEIMIVLAIAGLIMLIVFLAVPALQRSARNTQRKNDVGNVATAISDWTTNNNGATPGMTNGSYNSGGDSCATDLKNAISGIKLGYYVAGNVVCDGTYADTNPTPSLDKIIYDAGVTCNGNAVGTANQSSRSYVLVYEVETGSTSTPQCLEG